MRNNFAPSTTGARAKRRRMLKANTKLITSTKGKRSKSRSSIVFIFFFYCSLLLVLFMASHIRNLYFWQRVYPFSVGSSILITGAASGIGEHVAYEYAKRDCVLILMDRNASELQRVQERCHQIQREQSFSSASSSVSSSSSSSSSSTTSAPPPHEQCILIVVDVTLASDVKSLIESTLSTSPPLSTLVLCAGLGAHHVFSETKELKIFHRLMDVNYYGYLNVLHTCAPFLSASNGLCIAITSFSGEVGLPYRSAYCASKFAVTGLLESLRAEMNVLKSINPSTPTFDITIVCPPTIDTNLRKNSLTENSALKESEPSERLLTVKQCAEAVVDAGDRRLRKAFFPLKSMIASYLRPLVPDAIDRFIMAKAKL